MSLDPGDREYLSELIDRMSWEQLIDLYDSLSEIVQEGEENWQEVGDEG